ncbi:MAG: DUF1592 domain-containing protein [Nannocystales bacterium]
MVDAEMPDATDGADSGDPGTTGPGDGSSGDDGDNEPDAPAACGATSLGSAPMRRLTAVQYRNTIEALFGGAVDPGETFPQTDPALGGYSNDPNKNVVSQLSAEQIQMSAESVAASVADQLDTLAPCAEEASTCADIFIEDFGARAFRRPLRDDEHQLLKLVYDEVSANEDHPVGVAAVVAAALQMPQFLYLVEEGVPVPDEPGLVRLTDHEVAARLSYLLWDGPPDTALREAADAGRLQDPEEIREEIERMLASPEASQGLSRFYTEWLHAGQLDESAKDPEQFPDFSDALIASMREELSRTVGRLHDGGTLRDLLTSTTTEVDSTLAAHYGVDVDPAAEDSWWDIDLADQERAGVLTLPLVLASNSAERTTNAIERGLLVREQFLCNVLPPPPPDAEASVEFPAGSTEREKWALLSAEPTCASCHVLMNPIGLGLEHYDAVGAWRALDENGDPVDASGVVEGSDRVEFVGAQELGTALAERDATRDCYVSQWIQYSWGRHAESEDECVVQDVTAQFVDADSTLDEALLALLTSDAFLYRVTAEKE